MKHMEAKEGETYEARKLGNILKLKIEKTCGTWNLSKVGRKKTEKCLEAEGETYGATGVYGGRRKLENIWELGKYKSRKCLEAEGEEV